jgi:heat-inducible transcriptional repressor
VAGFQGQAVLRRAAAAVKAGLASHAAVPDIWLVTLRDMNMPADGLAALDNRSREIFRHIVESYLETGAPVGSRNVSRVLSAALSPASVRNVMSDLEDLGLIYAPHTSAGRMPTELGLRFFIDTLMEVGELSEAERQRIDGEINATGRGQSMDSLLSEASQMLSGMSRGAGLVIAAKQDIRLRHIEFVRVEPTKALAVLVAEGGAVENRIIDIPKGLPASALVEASNYLNAHFRGRTLSEARLEMQRLRDERRREVDKLTERVIAAGIATWSGAAEGQGTLIVRGMSNLIGDVKAVEDLERLRLLFDDIESKTEIIQLLGLAEQGQGVRIFIGAENKLFSLSGSSLVVAPFRDSGEKVVGVLGIVGPTRLNYARVVPAVNYTAQLITQLLGRQAGRSA